MKKVLLTKTIKTEPEDVSVYEQRKSMQSAYRALFQALFQLPDKHVQQRVLDAINDKYTPMECAKCKSERKRSLKSTETQTDFSYIMSSKVFTRKIAPQSPPSQLPIKNTEEKLQKVHKMPSIINDQGASKSLQDTSKIESDDFEIPEFKKPRKKRKRKVCVPQVVKKSIAQEYLNNAAKPKMSVKRMIHENQNATEMSRAGTPLDAEIAKRRRLDSIGSLSQYNLELVEVEPLIQLLLEESPPTQEEQIKVIMAKEFLHAKEYHEGLLPIHIAIISDDINKLKRQLWVWKNIIEADVNEILTDELEDCLQLAVANDVSLPVINVLLESGLNPNCLDNQSNTIIHMAILNDINIESLTVLLQRIDLDMMLTHNDDGYSPLHLAVRQDYYIIAELMLNTIDVRTTGQALYKRENSTQNITKDEFSKFYQISFERIDPTLLQENLKDKLKKKFLDNCEMKSGNTTLSFAVEFSLEHFIFLLLAHLSDPRIENHSGYHARACFNEFSKNLPLAVKIDRCMDRCTFILDGKLHLI